MYNYKLMRLEYRPLFYLMFIGGICTGSLVGITFGLLDRSSFGILGGAFITLLAGLASGILALIYTAVFNTLAPAIGGISIHIVPSPTPETKPKMDMPT
ncbi:hypothetical protein [Pelosinus sp. IPA-1]|uniref:hypothetical protein n=1 Tax=Pelosinus sp. IPA-1 TaxID=3029569 RepID=UPI0024361963|nr:hypothetical protein [Pelosinus sp. IPA-1]GMB01442.1 hypothetical protein PIPA1_42410 [Pelosinus sp. IPA-1]